MSSSIVGSFRFLRPTAPLSLTAARTVSARSSSLFASSSWSSPSSLSPLVTPLLIAGNPNCRTIVESAGTPPPAAAKPERRSPSTSTHVVPNSSSGAKPHCTEHAERCIIGFSPEKMFQVVANVPDYKNFVPYVVDSRIGARMSPDKFTGYMKVGFPPFTEQYTSVVELFRPSIITVDVRQSSLFHQLKTTWKFEPGPTSESCYLTFAISFLFRNSIHQTMAEMFFRRGVMNFRDSFEKRAGVIYGRKSCETKPIYVREYIDHEMFDH